MATGIGAAIGAFIVAYGPVILTTLSLAASIYMAFSAPGPPEGPKIGDTRVQTSTYGKVIPVGFGRIRLAGNIIWALDIQEVRNKVSVGGKGGGKQTQYTYFAHFAIGLAEGPAVTVSRIWADKKIIYDMSGNSEKPRKYKYADIRFYEGSATQLPDPMIEADLGVGSTPAFRGRVYVVFEDLPVADMGNRIPHMEFEVQFKTPLSTTEDDMPSMFDWGVDHIAESRGTGWLYIIRRSDEEYDNRVMSIAIMDKYTDAAVRQTGGYPYANEKGMKHNGFRPRTVHPGDDGRLFVHGRDATGTSVICKINPYNLSLITRWDIGLTYDLSAAPMRKTNCYWQQQAGLGTFNYGAFFSNGEAGGSPDSDGNKWLFYERGTISSQYANGNDIAYADLAENSEGNKIWPKGTFLYHFPLGVGDSIVWPNSQSIDAAGNLWVCGYKENEMDRGPTGDRGAKLWKVHLRMSGTKMACDLTEYDLVDLDPEGKIHAPQLMIYDRATNTLTIWGANAPVTGNYSVVQFELDTHSIINRVTYKPTVDPEYFPNRMMSGHGGQAVRPTMYSHFFNGTNSRGDVIFQKWSTTAEDQWVKYNAWDFSFTYPIQGPILSGDISQYYWDHDLEKIYMWNGGLNDNPSNDDPIVYGRKVITDSNDTLDAIVKSLISDVHVDVLTEVSTDATMAATIVDGFIIGTQGSVRSAINPLGFAYFFDAVESDSTIAFRSRGSASIRTIDEDDLGSRPGSEGKGEPDILITNREQETDIPARVDLVYMDVTRDYLDGNQHAQRMENPTPTQFSKSVSSNALPIVMTPDRAKSIAEAKLYDSWAARLMHKFQFGPKHMDLEPTDIITIDTTAMPDIVMRVAQTQLGEAFVTRAESITHDVETLTTVGTGADSTIPGGALDYQGPTFAFLLDIPLLRDQDGTGGSASNVYVAMGGMRDAWVAGTLTKSIGNTAAGPFVYFEASRGESTWGYTDADIDALPNATHQTGDILHAFNEAYTRFQPEMSIVVQVVGGIDLLESRTLTEVLETGENTLVVLHDETPQDKFEIIQFTDVSISTEYATLTGLSRGIRGTEEMGREGFVEGSLVVFIDPDITTLQALPLDEIDAIKFYAAETARESEDTTRQQDYTHQGNDLKPLPVGYTWLIPAVGSRSGSDVTVKGYRRTRIGGESDLDSAQVEIDWGEDTLTFEMDLMDKGADTVAQTYTLSDPDTFISPGFAVSVSERNAAGYTDPDEAITVRIYQVSSVTEIGRGFPRELTG